MAACDSSFTPYEVSAGPELAAENALLQASAYLEQAIHSITEGDTWCSLGVVSDRLSWALADLALVGDEDQLDACQCLAATVDAIVASGGLPVNTDLATFQVSELLPLQVQIAEVMAIPERQAWRQIRRDDRATNLALLGVLGAAVVVAGAAGYIDYKQSHGGYHRGPRGVARPVVAYRYPR